MWHYLHSWETLALTGDVLSRRGVVLSRSIQDFLKGKLDRFSNILDTRCEGKWMMPKY